MRQHLYPIYQLPVMSPLLFPFSQSKLSGFDDGWRVRILNFAVAAASSFDGLHHAQGLVVADFAEDDVLAVKPAGDHGGNEKL